MLDKAKLLNKLDEEIEFAKGCGMPQFVMGLIQAKKVISEQEEVTNGTQDDLSHARTSQVG